MLPFVQPWQVLSTFPIEAPPLDMTPTLTGSGTGRLSASRSASLLSQGWERALPAAVGVVLLAGALVRLSWLSAGLIRLRRLRAAGSPAEITEGHRELTALTEAGAEIRYVPVIGQPVTFGVRHPVVLLPESLQALPDQIQRAVLAHELWHVRRRDWLWILAEETIRAVLWFHPAIWYLVSRVQSSREEVVDELTVLLTNARRTYIEALLAFADEPPLFAAAPFARRRHLFQRMLLISREAVMSSKRIVASTAAMAIAVLLTGWYGVAAFPLAAARSETSGTSVPAAALTQGARQAPPRDLKPGQAAPPTNREIELQKAVDAGTVKTVEEYVVLARMQEQRGALAEAEATLLSARRVANPETKALPPLAGFYQRTGRFDKAIAIVEEIAAADPTNPKVHQMVASYYWDKAFKDQKLSDESENRVHPSGYRCDRSGAVLRSRLHGRADLQEHLPPAAGEHGDRQDQTGPAHCGGGCAEKPRIGIDEGTTSRGRSFWRSVVLAEYPAASRAESPVALRADMPPPPPPPPPPPGEGSPLEVDGIAPVRVGGNMRPPTKITDVRPVYPPEAKGARVQGVVILEVVIDTEGNVRSARVLRSIPILDAAAITAVEQWKFEPTLLNGAAVPVIMTVTVNFTLE